MHHPDQNGIHSKPTLRGSSACLSTRVKPAVHGCGVSSRSNAGAMKVGINCLQIDPSYVGGVTTYVLGLLEGFADAGSGCRFRLFATGRNQHLFGKFATHDNFDWLWGVTNSFSWVTSFPGPHFFPAVAVFTDSRLISHSGRSGS